MSERTRRDLARIVRGLEAFLSERDEGEPAITFDRSHEEYLTYFATTMREYRERFAHHVVALRDDLLELGVQDDELDQFAIDPVNLIMMRRIVVKLKAIELRLAR